MGVKYYKRVWASSKQKGSHKLTLLALAELTNEDTGQCNPSHETLAEMVGISDRQIRNVLADLAKAGEIEITTHRGRTCTNQYTILLENRKSNNKTGATLPVLDDKIGSPLPVLEEEIGSQVPIKEPENRKPTSGIDAKIGNLASENRKPTSYEPIEPRTTSARARGGNPPGQPLVPRKPVFGGTNTAKPAHKLKIDSPHISARKLAGGLIPAGQGNTAVEIVHERYPVNEYRDLLSAPQEDDLVREVKDLGRWRQVVTSWSQHGFSGKNIAGMLDWYRQGIPERNGKTPSGAVETSWAEKFANQDLPDYILKIQRGEGP